MTPYEKMLAEMEAIHQDCQGAEADLSVGACLLIARKYAPVASGEDVEQNLSICPGCGGDADNGHNRGLPPSPYYCTKCTAAMSAQVWGMNLRPARKLAVLHRVSSSDVRVVAAEFSNVDKSGVSQTSPASPSEVSDTFQILPIARCGVMARELVSIGHEKENKLIEDALGKQYNLGYDDGYRAGVSERD